MITSELLAGWEPDPEPVPEPVPDADGDVTVSLWSVHSSVPTWHTGASEMKPEH